MRPRIVCYQLRFKEIMPMFAVAIATAKRIGTRCALSAAGPLGLHTVGPTPERLVAGLDEKRLPERSGRLSIVGSNAMQVHAHPGAHWLKNTLIVLSASDCMTRCRCLAGAAPELR